MVITKVALAAPGEEVRSPCGHMWPRSNPVPE